eukprot:TRINITY_DN7288_c0_g1_i2.p1 TRINITY_DN7288_c0_g1~~TRINITY_DN7288_c0_g1_i2.p1  ORF type:complete len:122 (-),score=13.69 TRINITY_DN7288_c0_g1_i2:414-734(-)
MACVNVWFALACCTAKAMSPLAFMAQQPVWQAGLPVEVNVDFDVPASGTTDEFLALREADQAENSVAQRRSLLAKGPQQQTAELPEPLGEYTQTDYQTTYHSGRQR